MEPLVRKRTGKVVPFSRFRIINAVYKAMKATNIGSKADAEKIADAVAVYLYRNYFKKGDIPHVETIQDIIEKTLMERGFPEVAKAYILYREKRRQAREIGKALVDGINLIEEYLGNEDWRVRENSNMSFSLQGLNFHVSSSIVARYWLEKLYPEEVARAHKEGDFHIHDLGILGPYCVGWDLYDLLLRGFGGVYGKVESKPAKHFRSALGQIVNFFYTLQGECYSADTQVLTDKGWKYFWEVTKDDKVFTLNPQTHKIELQTPIRFYEFDYDGELYHFKSKKLDLLVTPNHNMFVEQYCPKCKNGNYYKKFVKAKDFNPNIHFIPKGGIWEGIKKDYFILPGIKVFYYRHFLNPLNSQFFSSLNKPLTTLNFKKYNTLTNLHMALKYEVVCVPELKIPMNEWLKFFGIWLAEGTTTLRERKRKERNKTYYEYQIRICQNKGEIVNEIEEVLRKLPFKYIKKERGEKIEFVIYNKQLFLYLKQFGKAQNKYIPQEIKNLSREQLEILFEWMMKGDGYIGNGNIDYYTKSKRLADDVQEIVLKLGYSANIYEKKKNNFTWYRVSISKTKYFKLQNKNITKVKYKGKVYCLEVPNHVLFVRRNGKACWCGNSAGAQAFSNFDTLLAPFVRYDKLSYPDVKQCMQEFLFNVNVPTRVGFQCLSEDTQILTPFGWKTWQEVNEGDLIYTFNLKNQTIEIKEVTYVFKKHYEGFMYNLKNRSQDQLISPGHRVVRQIFNTNQFILQPIEELLKFKSPITIPVTGENLNEDYPISDEELKLIAWILSKGSIEKGGSRRVSIYQSKEKNPENYQEIISLLNNLELEYTEREQEAWGKCIHIRLYPKASKFIHSIIGNPKKIFPKFLYKLSKRQAKLFIETYAKGDGWLNGGRLRIITTDREFADGLLAIGVLAGYNVSERVRNPEGNTKKIRYELTFTQTKTDYIQKIDKVPYSGIIWSVHTENETVIAKRAGQVFITGNTPFTNLTFDLKPSKLYAKANVIIGGKPQEETYEEFHKEMSMINRAFCELMMEGDAKGRIFTFPIPTYNITKDFDWDNPDYEVLWEMTRKYGIPYFANFVNSDMDPDDARSMCIDGNEEVLIRNSKKVKRISIRELVENYKKDDFDEEGWADCKKDRNLEILSLNPKTLKLEWVPVKRFLKIKDNKAIKVVTEDGKSALFSFKHPVPVYTPEGIKMKFAKDLQKGDYLLILKKANENIYSKEYQKFEDLVLDEDLAKILGYFVADGNYLFESRKGYSHFGEPRGLQFTFKTGDKENLEQIKFLIKKVFNLSVHEKQDPRYNSYYLYVYNAKIARKLYRAGFLKYGRLPQILFNSPKSVIESFLEFYFRGDGYERRKEIHLNDLELSRDLVLLFSLVGKPVTYKVREKSQRIYLQHLKSETKRNGNINTPILAERVPGWMAASTYKVPGLKKSRMVGLATLEKYNANTEESLKIKDSDIYLAKIKEIEVRQWEEPKEFYDVELEKNHLFVHSLGFVSFNCCRLRLDQRELRKRGGGLFGANPLTGSIGVVTINLPRIGYLSTCEEEFFERLEALMELAKTSLEIKRKVIEDFTEKGLYPYSKFYLQSVKEARGQYWANHFSTIGVIGMNEMCLNFLGKPIYDPSAKEFAIKVLKFMRNKIADFQEETGNFYNLEATPAEGTSYRLAKIDKKKFPRIKTAGTEQAPYYTNSCHLPVNYTDDIFEILTHQDDLQVLFTGGTVVHLFVGEEIIDRNIVKELIKAIVENFRLPYFSITPTFSVCPVHGYLPGKHEFCPYPHTEEELEKFGIELELPVTLLNKLPKEAYKIL